MSVKYVTGDLLDFPNDITVIAHCTNCQCTLGDGKASGIAGEIGRRYPDAIRADKQAHEEGLAKLGNISFAFLDNGLRIANLYGQDQYGRDRRHLNYEAFYHALETLKMRIIQSKEWRLIDHVVGFPYKIGSDRAGGSWRIVEAMICDLFEDSPIRCFIVKLP